MACIVLPAFPRRRTIAAQGRNMENQQQETGVSAPAGGRKPWAAYNIIERQGGRRIWSRVGTAFKNRDGSINIFLDSLPIGGKIQIREDDREHQAREPGALAGEAEA
ncbi:MAG TPA: hypothetical protein VIR81_07365 [Myxococcales bacterium]|nr:hypothetical protein [Myxococcales bacterium]